MKNRPLAIAGTILSVGAHSLNSFGAESGNILVIVADDLGREVLSFYDSPVAQRAVTPNLDRLAERGVVFDNFWGSPLSAPARAAMLTGRYGHHTGIISLDVSLAESERTIFDALPKEYSNAVIGKWHLSQSEDFASGYGIDHFAGFATGGGVRDYYGWRFTEDGKTEFTREYTTTKITDSAKSWIERQEGAWFCWVAYNAPHTPYHLPPANMHTRELSGSAEDIEQNTLPYFLAMVESLDYDIGRLLESVDDSTTIIFVGDNGTANEVLQPPYPYRHGKGSLYESGVAIPMVVAGAAVERGGVRSDVMVSAVDIFPTVMELVGVDMASYEDSWSFRRAIDGGESEREFLFSEIFNRRNGGHLCSLSDGEYKIVTSNGEETMIFALDDDPFETNNLLGARLSKEAEAAIERLRKELKRMKIPVITPTQSTTQRGPRQGGGAGANRGQMREGGDRGAYGGRNNSNQNRY